jgi:hypothetical protein
MSHQGLAERFVPLCCCDVSFFLTYPCQAEASQDQRFQSDGGCERQRDGNDTDTTDANGQEHKAHPKLQKICAQGGTRIAQSDQTANHDLGAYIAGRQRA